MSILKAKKCVHSNLHNSPTKGLTYSENLEDNLGINIHLDIPDIQRPLGRRLQASPTCSSEHTIT